MKLRTPRKVDATKKGMQAARNELKNARNDFFSRHVLKSPVHSQHAEPLRAHSRGTTALLSAAALGSLDLLRIQFRGRRREPRRREFLHSVVRGERRESGREI